MERLVANVGISKIVESSKVAPNEMPSMQECCLLWTMLFVVIDQKTQTNKKKQKWGWGRERATKNKGLLPVSP